MKEFIIALGLFLVSIGVVKIVFGFIKSKREN
jgi:hypothetical protein